MDNGGSWTGKNTFTLVHPYDFHHQTRKIFLHMICICSIISEFTDIIQVYGATQFNDNFNKSKTTDYEGIS